MPVNLFVGNPSLVAVYSTQYSAGIVPPTVIVKCVVCTPVPQHLSSDTTAQHTGGRVHIYQYLDIGISRPELCRTVNSLTEQ